MPMGASLSSDIYQYKVDGNLEGIDHCVVMTDDMIIYRFVNEGTDHDKTVRDVMKKLKKWVCILTSQNANSEKLN